MYTGKLKGQDVPTFLNKMLGNGLLFNISKQKNRGIKTKVAFLQATFVFI